MASQPVSGDLGAAAPSMVLGDLLPGRLVRDVLLVVSFTAAIAFSAELEIPLGFTPVPITGQTFAVLAGAMLLGSRRAAAGSGLYLAGGLVGLPLFTSASAVTLGYIIGFVFAAGLVGWLARRGFDRRPTTTIAAMVAGNLVIYAFGVPYLAAAAGMNLGQALDAGVVPFLIGDGIKILLAAAVLPGAWQLVGDRD